MLRTIKRPTVVALPRQVHRPHSFRYLSTQGQKDGQDLALSGEPSAGRSREQAKDEAARPLSKSTVGDSEPVQDRLRTWSIQNLRELRTRMDDFSAMAQLTFHRLGGRLNEVTGYHEIEVLKRLVAENEKEMLKIREEAKAAKEAYEQAVAKRSASQRETNDLLQRKSHWSEDDVLNFTRLVRADHLHEQEEARTKARYAELDASADTQFAELMRTILARYHEEQVWSDKIRSASTYGSLAALGLNLLVFILAIVLVEPWKRRRLVQSFEQRVVELNEANQRATEVNLGGIKSQVDAQRESLAYIQTMLQVAAPLNDGGDGVVEVAPLPDVNVQVHASSLTKLLGDHRGLSQTVAGSLGGIALGLLLGSWFR